LLNNIIPEPWLSFLKALDEAASCECPLHCLGGFVVTFFYGFSRTTADLDVLSLPLVTGDDRHRRLIELGRKHSGLHKKYGVYLDCVSVANLPEGYEDRLTEMIPGRLRHIRLSALDPYDLALSKLELN